MDAAAILAVVCVVLVVLLALSYRRCGVLRDENIILRAQVAKFDRDGNGRVGGSHKRPSPPTRPVAHSQADWKAH